jgi:hypothetical protein
MSYNNSSDMGNYIYTRNYRMSVASKEQREHNLKYLQSILPFYERDNVELYIDPGGNISRDCLGNIKRDINKILDGYKNNNI